MTCVNLNKTTERVTTMADMAAVVSTDPIQAMHNVSIRMPLDTTKYENDELSINLATMLLCMPEYPPRRVTGSIVLQSGVTYNFRGSQVYVS